MSRYRLVVSTAQETVLLEHCAHARFVWNLAVEQHSWWRPGRGSAPGYLEQCRQLTAARRQNPWLAAGRQMVQQQALRDFDQAMRNFCAGTHRRPRWRKAERNEGFRIVAVKSGHVRRLSRNTGAVWVPKAGWIRFRWSRAVPGANQRCSACGHVDSGSRESQARFRCTACGNALNADVNAARNIAAGHTVTARGGVRAAGPVNREPRQRGRRAA